MTNNDPNGAIRCVKDATEHVAAGTAADFRVPAGRLDRVETQMHRLQTRIASVEGGRKAMRADIAELKRRTR